MVPQPRAPAGIIPSVEKTSSPPPKTSALAKAWRRLRGRADRGPGRGAAHPRAPRTLGARARQAGPARASARLAAKRGHPHHLPPGPRYRVAQCEGQVRPHVPLALRNRPTRLRIRALSTSSALQSAGRRRNILWVRCSAALNEQQTAAIDPTREKRQD